jgi:hypothetical protein
MRSFNEHGSIFMAILYCCLPRRAYASAFRMNMDGGLKGHEEAQLVYVAYRYAQYCRCAKVKMSKVVVTLAA